MTHFRELPAVHDWFTNSGELFGAIKREFSLPDAWVFSIAQPDVVPSDTDPEDLRDIRGSAAFMLRRIQAMRALIAGDSESSGDLMLGYASDLYAFLSALTSRALVGNPLDEQLLIAATTRTRNLVQAVVNGDTF